jgi:hypothetical protein
VAPGIVELEAGLARQTLGHGDSQSVLGTLFKIGLTPALQLDIQPAWQRNAEGGTSTSGLTDVLVAAKWLIARDSPVLGSFAVQPGVVLPTGDEGRGFGAGTGAFNILLISSRSVGPVSLDINVGYTRRGGDGSVAPKDATLWAVAGAAPIAGPLGLAVELFGLPGTSGPSGEPPSVGFLVGPSYAFHPSLVADAGVILDISGVGGTSVYGGLTWNIGRAWTARAPSPSRNPVSRD